MKFCDLCEFGYALKARKICPINSQQVAKHNFRENSMQNSVFQKANYNCRNVNIYMLIWGTVFQPLADLYCWAKSWILRWRRKVTANVLQRISLQGILFQTRRAEIKKLRNQNRHEEMDLKERHCLTTWVHENWHGSWRETGDIQADKVWRVLNVTTAILYMMRCSTDNECVLLEKRKNWGCGRRHQGSRTQTKTGKTVFWMCWRQAMFLCAAP